MLSLKTTYKADELLALFFIKCDSVSIKEKVIQKREMEIQMASRNGNSHSFLLILLSCFSSHVTEHITL